MNALPIENQHLSEAAAAEPRTSHDGKPSKPSRAAEYIAALYVALVLCTPWLLRDASMLTPPSKGVEIQMSRTAPAALAVELKAPAMPAKHQP
jgi:hypothetical protein